MFSDGQTSATRREKSYRGRWSLPVRCSICTDSIPFAPIALSEPPDEWILCKSCHEALLIEMRHSSVHLSMRLRIAMGLVAAERSPLAYSTNSHFREQRAFQREFVWAIRLMVFFALLHIVIFAVVLSIPR